MCLTLIVVQIKNKLVPTTADIAIYSLPPVSTVFFNNFSKTTGLVHFEI